MVPASVRFLTREWASALDEAARSSAALRECSRDLDLTIEQEVVDDDGEPVRYALVFDHGDVRVVWGAADAADVTFVQSRDAAEEMSRGELNAQRAFVLGKLRVRGDVDKLLSARDAFARLEDDVFAAVRADTVYS